MAHTGAGVEVLRLCLSSTSVFDVSLPDHYVGGRVVYGLWGSASFGSGHVPASRRGQDFEMKHTGINRFIWVIWTYCTVILHLCFIPTAGELRAVDPPWMETVWKKKQKVLNAETLKFHTTSLLKIRDLYSYNLWHVNAISFRVHPQIEIMNDCGSKKCGVFNWWSVIEFPIVQKLNLGEHFGDFAGAHFTFSTSFGHENIYIYFFNSQSN